MSQILALFFFYKMNASGWWYLAFIAFEVLRGIKEHNSKKVNK